MPSAHEITTFIGDDPDDAEWVSPDPSPGDIRVVEYDPRWPELYAGVERRIRDALGDRALAIEHVGSTSVPGLPAKPIVDIDLTVADNADEPAYADALLGIGSVLRVREPGWYGHRLFIVREPRAFVHVWSPDSPEAIRHRMLRDHLIRTPADRDLYVAAKRAAAAEIAASGGDMMAYNRHKEPVLQQILARVFREAGLLD